MFKCKLVPLEEESFSFPIAPFAGHSPAAGPLHSLSSLIKDCCPREGNALTDGAQKSDRRLN